MRLTSAGSAGSRWPAQGTGTGTGTSSPNVSFPIDKVAYRRGYFYPARSDIGPGEAGASGAGMGRRLDDLPIVREQSLKVSQDEAVATTGPKARRTTKLSPGQDQLVGG